MKLITSLLLLLASVLKLSLAGDCSGQWILEGFEEGVVSDGPGDYPTLIECSWVIKAEPGKVITLIFDSFSTECGWDHLHVHDGPDPSYTNLGAFSGELLPPPIVSSSNYLYLGFFSDLSLISSGFDAYYIISECPYNCSSSGFCDKQSGICECDVDFYGKGCENEYCPNDCGSSNGYCNIGVGCICNEGFTGSDCTTLITEPRWGLETHAPRPISASEVVYSEETDKLYVFGGFSYEGGYDDLLIYGFDTKEWRSLKVSPSPSKRYDHTFTLVGKKIYLFGGRSKLDSYNDFWVFDTVSEDWTLIITNDTQQVMSPVFGHAAVYSHLTDSILIMGGQTLLSGLSGEFHEFSILNDTWQQILSKPRSNPFHFHSMVYENSTNRAIIYGGFWSSGARNRILPFIFGFTPASEQFTQYIQSSNPMQRYNHKSTLLGEYMITFGGLGIDTCFVDNLSAYHTACDRWVSLSIASNLNLGMGRQSFGMIQRKGSLYIIGGYSGYLRSDVNEFIHDKCWFYSSNITCSQQIHCHWNQTMYGCLEIPTEENKHRRGVLAFNPIAPDPTGVFCSSCSRLFTPTDCNLIDGCEWCEKTGVCKTQEVPDSPPEPQCLSSDPCSTMTSCGLCNENPNCLWCASKQMCNNAQNVTMSGCLTSEQRRCFDPCSNYLTCSECAIESTCVWCDVAKHCITDSSSFSCDAANYDRKTKTCTQPCSQRNSCFDCSLNQYCIWCENLKQCTDSDLYTTTFTYGMCEEWSYGYGDCKAPCEQVTNCQTCMRRTNCLWCSDSGTCTTSRFDQIGNSTCSGGNITLSAASCPAIVTPPPTQAPTSGPTQAPTQGPTQAPTTPPSPTSTYTNTQLIPSPSSFTTPISTPSPTPTPTPTAKACRCNGHSDTCDSQGVCLNCTGRTQNGLQNACETCMENYFGYPLNGGTCWLQVVSTSAYNSTVSKYESLYMRTFGSTSSYQMVKIYFKVSQGNGLLFVSTKNPRPSFSDKENIIEDGENSLIENSFREVYMTAYGYEPMVFEVRVEPQETIRIKGGLQNGVTLLFYVIIFFMTFFGILFVVTFGYRMRMLYVNRAIQEANQQLEMNEARTFHQVLLVPSTKESHPLGHPITLDKVSDPEYPQLFVATVMIELPNPKPKSDPRVCFGHVLFEKK